MAKWIKFVNVGRSAGGKTERWAVSSKEGHTGLGEVNWYGRWRCYTFNPFAHTVFEHQCLRDIADFCEARTKEHRARPVPPEEARPRPEIVCFCGSSRFVAEMAILMWECEKLGKIAMGLHLLPVNYPGLQVDHQAESEGVAAAMDELHLRKIDLADEVFVVNVGGYIGDSTRREIAHAEAHGKSVRYLEARPVPAEETTV